MEKLKPFQQILPGQIEKDKLCYFAYIMQKN